MTDLQRYPLGQILVDKGYITRAQLFSALDYQMRLPPSHHKPLGEVLIELELVDKKTLQQALDQQPNFNEEPIGRILVEEKVIEEWQLARALKEQFDREPNHKRLGVILVDLGFSTRQAIEEGLKRYKQKKQKLPLQQTVRMSANELKDILLEDLIVEQWQLDHVEHLMADGATEGLGTLLVKLGYATRKAITAAIAKHFDKTL